MTIHELKQKLASVIADRNAARELGDLDINAGFALRILRLKVRIVNAEAKLPTRAGVCPHCLRPYEEQK